MPITTETVVAWIQRDSKPAVVATASVGLLCIVSSRLLHDHQFRDASGVWLMVAAFVEGGLTSASFATFVFVGLALVRRRRVRKGGDPSPVAKS